jgi:hypothetical protein
VCLLAAVPAAIAAAAGRRNWIKQEELPVMSLVQIELPQNQFNNVIRMVRRSEAERVLVLRNATFNALKALGVKRDLSMVVVGMPTGSNQVDIGSVIAWVKKIKLSDTAAIAQLLQIDATCVACSS